MSDCCMCEKKGGENVLWLKMMRVNDLNLVNSSWSFPLLGDPAPKKEKRSWR